jgi:hypothetical protein
MALFNDLWLDEIWTVEGAFSLPSLLSVYTLKSDNNHLSTTAFAYLIGHGHPPALYRLLSFAAGCGALGLVLYVTKGTVRIFTIAIFSSSFLLTLHDSEARGYAPLALASLAAYAAHSSYRATLLTSRAFCFWSSTVLGGMSHLLFVQLSTAFLLFDFLRPPPRGTKDRLLLLHLPVVVFWTALWTTHIQYLPPGTGPLGSRWIVLLTTISVACGGPEITISDPHTIGIALVACICVGAILWSELRKAAREGDSEASFFPLVIAIAPLLFVGVANPRVLFPRYLTIPIVFSYLIAGRFCGRLWGVGRVGKFVATLLCLAFMSSNLTRVTTLLRHGRGDYHETLRFIAAHDPTPEVRVAGDFPTRTETIIRFYQPTLPKRISYMGETPTESPQWYLQQSQDRALTPSVHLERGGARYDLVRATNFAGQSGWRWFVYRRREQ